MNNDDEEQRVKISSRISVSLNGEFWLALVLVYFTSISIRLTEYPLWQDSSLFVNGEPLMATHDAYAWLAGVKGIGFFKDLLFTRLLSSIHKVFDINLALVGFWSPVIFVPFLAIPICLMARSLRLPEGGLLSGILATSGIGYLVRTRLGFCDTDVLSLFFPVSVACGVVIWITPLLQRISSESKAVLPSSSQFNAIVKACCIGILGTCGILFHASSTSIILASFLLTGLVGMIWLRKGARDIFWAGLLLMFAMTFSGWSGSLVAGCWALWCLRKTEEYSAWYQIAAMAIIAMFIFFLANTHEMLWSIIQRIFFYAKASSPDLINATSTLKLPDIAQSVREAQNLDWSQIGARMGGNWIVFSLGMCGFGFVLWRRPALIIFMPFLALGLASVKLGNRFSMYGTVAIGLGLGLGLSELLSMWGQSQGRRWIAQLLMACVALWPSAQFITLMSAVPVLPQTYAQTFLELRKLTEPNALLWQWWDYGYAGQYYAERATLGDGGRQSGPYVYTLGKIHSAVSPRQASQWMRYFGQVVVESGSMNVTDARMALLMGNPVANIEKMSAGAAHQFIDDLGQSVSNWPTTVPNYLVLSWENLRLASWISYYGNWDIVSGTSAPGKIQQVRGEARLDTVAGTLSFGEKTASIDSLDVVDQAGTKHFEWSNGSGTHVVVNQFSRQVFVMDLKMYSSMMVQMLLRPAEDFTDEFTLVVDNFPWVRAYKVKN